MVDDDKKVLEEGKSGIIAGFFRRQSEGAAEEDRSDFDEFSESDIIRTL